MHIQGDKFTFFSKSAQHLSFAGRVYGEGFDNKARLVERIIKAGIINIYERKEK